ncbi:hypothetical protein Hokovirus_3_19 [Hokovirus HKV1]|uniref:Uncharacterized protein n=1 Tax=Hokovirus HKV1 TaxID=1977638 RepID=A0A1V0SG92_9VIRU|nr:hypothetical protein Hokovirus_3_19 [Hokovirus HKV1]
MLKITPKSFDYKNTINLNNFNKITKNDFNKITKNYFLNNKRFYETNKVNKFTKILNNNQSINKSINQESINQSINKSINQESINQSINQESINQESINQEPTKQEPIKQKIKQEVMTKQFFESPILYNSLVVINMITACNIITYYIGYRGEVSLIPILIAIFCPISYFFFDNKTKNIKLELQMFTMMLLLVILALYMEKSHEPVKFIFANKYIYMAIDQIKEKI